MYMAKSIVDGRMHYCLRHSYETELGFFSRDLFDLGEDPSRYLIYPGGNAFYVDEALEEGVKKTMGIHGNQAEDLDAIVDGDALEALLWPFVRPEIRRAVETFQSRGREREKSVKGKMSQTDREIIRYGMPRFDKRRLHYLKFGRMDQGAVENMPDVIFRSLLGKSRDEIEQYFLHEERRLKNHEQKSYLYAAMDIQRFFQSFMAKQMPHVLDQDAVDAHFIENLCQINQTLFNDRAFDYEEAVRYEKARQNASMKKKSAAKEEGAWANASTNQGEKDTLHPYLVRYVIMFFDHEYAGTTLLDDFAKRFMNAHRTHRAPPPKKRVKEDQALETMELSKRRFHEMTPGDLTRHYRKLAGKHHPDRGGSHDAFVALSDAFESLLERL